MSICQIQMSINMHGNKIDLFSYDEKDAVDHDERECIYAKIMQNDIKSTKIIALYSQP